MANHGKISSESCFFRKIMPHLLQNGTLDLPRDFTKKHWKSFSKHASLEVPTGAKSKMKMKKSEGRAWLRKAWQDFVEKYSIKDGYFLVFRYQGRSNFSVQIFDSSTEEIDYVRTSHKFEVDFDIKEEQCDDDDDDDDKYKEMEMHNHSRNLKSVLNSSPAEKNSPHFSIIMKQADVSKNYYMYIPNYARPYFHNKGKDDIYLSLEGENGKVWSMKYYTGSPPHYSPRISSGWRGFSAENNLKEGDMCAFEPLSSTDMIFKVTISRTTDEQVKERWKKGHIGMSDVSPRGTKRKRDLGTSFAVTMSKTNVKAKCRLNIPRAHSARYLHDQHGKEVFLHRVDGETRRVKCEINGLDGRFIHGWKDFVEDNDLQEGDTCVFELFPEKPNHYKVAIFSGVV